MRVLLAFPPKQLRALLLLIWVVSLGSTLAPHKAVAQNSGTAVHVVGWGETLLTIAQRYGVSADAIIVANGLSDPNHLYAGQTLAIPGGASAAASRPAAGTYVVQPGDGLYRVALNYGVSVEALMAANGLSNPDQVYAGQVLVVPGSGGPAAPSVVSPSSGVHVVQPGETLFRISQQHGVSVDALTAANSLLSASQIYAGQQLVIPGPGAAPSTPPTSPAGSPELSGTHIVQPGETLAIIAAQYGVSASVLAQSNNLSNPSLIYAGQRLVVPGAGTGGPAAQPPSANPGAHVVQPGDTLFRIALRYGVSLSDLLAANGLNEGSIIYTGQQLRIPGGTGGPAPAANLVAAPSANPAPPTITTGKQIVVKLAAQRVFAYENGQLLREFVVSTGLPATPTVTGDYAIYVKYDSQTMAGPDYYLPGVPWVMYFYRGYGFHGTYWHNNFGQPMSHGCVNMRTAEAEWLYMWAPIGTPVHVEW